MLPWCKILLSLSQKFRYKYHYPLNEHGPPSCKHFTLPFCLIYWSNTLHSLYAKACELDGWFHHLYKKHAPELSNGTILVWAHFALMVAYGYKYQYVIHSALISFCEHEAVLWNFSMLRTEFLPALVLEQNLWVSVCKLIQVQ